MARFLDTVSVEVAAMFRDPYFHKAFRERVVPGLKARPLVRVWHAGCATGEEVYSLAILLHEEGLLEKAKLYATGLNAWALERGKDGIFPMKRAGVHRQLPEGRRPGGFFRLLHGQTRRRDHARFAAQEYRLGGT